MKLRNIKRVVPVFCFLVLLHTITNRLYAQAPTIQWARCLGGTDIEGSVCIDVTSDGGTIVAGWANSNDGDVSGYHGNEDAWLIKLRDNGAIAWQKCLGDTADDIANWVRQTDDGGYIMVGSTASVKGEVSGNHGGMDIWVVKIDDTGRIQWQKCLGGSGSEFGYFIDQTKDAGYIVMGSTNSNDGDVSGLHDSTDAWIVKLNSTGGIIWQKCFGGSRIDVPTCIRQTADSGYIFTAVTNSNDGDVSGNHGGRDVWVVKLSSDGNLQWRRCLGGSNDDYSGTNNILQTADGGYILSATVNSTDGDVIGNHGSSDYWVVKLMGSGSLTWQKCFGGSNNDWGNGIQKIAGGGYVLTGFTGSDDGDVSGKHGLYFFDYWVVRMDDTGKLLWQKCLGGTKDDRAYCIRQTQDSGYVIVGQELSDDGDVSGLHTGITPAFDIWVVKLAKDSVGLIIPSGPANLNAAVWPNPAHDRINIVNAQSYRYNITTLSGKILLSGQIDFPKQELDISRLNLGVYILQLNSRVGKKQFIKFVKQ